MVTFGETIHPVVPFSAVEVKCVASGACDTNVVAFGTILAVIFGVTKSVEVALNVKGLKVVTFCAILSVVTIFIVTGSINDAFPAGSTVVLRVAVTLGETNGAIVPLRSVAVADVTFGGTGRNVSFCTIFPDVVYIVIGPTDDVFAANDTEVVYDDTGHAVGTLISREDGLSLIHI